MPVDDTNLILLSGGHARCTASWTKGATGIDQCYKIYLPRAGAARLEMEGGTHAIRPGFVYFISGFRLRRQVCERRLDVDWAHFVPASLYLRYLFDQVEPVRAWPRRELGAAAAGFREIGRVFDAPHRHHNRPRADVPPAVACRTQGILLAFVSRLLEDLDDRRLRAFQPVYFRLKPALDYLHVHARRNPPLAEIAAQVHLAPNYFHRRFRRHFGMTPFEYMLAGRMNQARHLLTSTDLSVQEVADRAGYENPLYFSRLFAARIGLTPTAYRALHRGAGLEGGRPSRRVRAASRRPS